MDVPSSPPLKVREQDLIGKLSVITGGTRGIGRATALHLASRGCSVLVTCSSSDSLHHISSLSQSLAEIYRSHKDLEQPSIRGIVADIYSADCASKIADAVDRSFSGHLDFLILNAAATYITDVGALKADEVSKSLMGNVQTSAMIVDILVERKMFRQNGRILYLSSIRGRMPWKRQLIYSASKAAGEMMCKTWSECFGGKHEEFAFMAGTTANAIVVGLTATDAVLNMPKEILPEIVNEFIPHQDIPKTAVPEDVADAIGMLCGNDARWITGQSISVSGGLVKIQ